VIYDIFIGVVSSQFRFKNDVPERNFDWEMTLAWRNIANAIMAACTALSGYETVGVRNCRGTTLSRYDTVAVRHCRGTTL
jgi:hypothetical protein